MAEFLGRPSGGDSPFAIGDRAMRDTRAPQIPQQRNPTPRTQYRPSPGPQPGQTFSSSRGSLPYGQSQGTPSQQQGGSGLSMVSPGTGGGGYAQQQFYVGGYGAQQQGYPQQQQQQQPPSRQFSSPPPQQPPQQKYQPQPQQYAPRPTYPSQAPPQATPVNHPAQSQGQRQGQYNQAPLGQPQYNPPIQGRFSQTAQQGQWAEPQMREPPPPPPAPAPVQPLPQTTDEYELSTMFNQFDSTYTGQLSAHDLQRLLAKDGKTKMDAREDCVKMLMNIFDTDQSGSINYQEFEGLYRYIQDWHGIFNRFDRDASGLIDRSELHSALLGFGFSLPPALVQKVEKRFAPPPGAATGGIGFDRFLMACVTVKHYTEGFNKIDERKEGRVDMDYNQFMEMVLDAPS